MYKISAFSLLICSFFSSVAHGSSIDGETLIYSCQELIAIYDRKGEKKLFAGMSTSVAEAMRAGICRGMIEEHKEHYGSCYSGWHSMAKKIALSDPDKVLEAEQLLKQACRG